MSREEIEAIFAECADIANAHVGQCIPARMTGEHCGCYDAACRDIAEAIRTRASNRKTMDAIADADLSNDLRWRAIDTAPHETYVLLGWWDDGSWNSSTGFASHGWRRGAFSTMSMHGQASHWMPLPAPPALLKP